jgi:uncharacterized protein
MTDHFLFSASLLEACSNALSAYASQQAGVDAVVLSSADGQQLSRATFDTDLANRMSAVTSSLFALGEVTSREAQLGVCNHVIVESTNGRMLVFSIPLLPDWLVLSIVAKKDALLGALLWSGGNLAEELRERFEQALVASRGHY